MTPILKVLTEYCAVYVNDINLQKLAQEDMPLYARRMWGLFRPAISRFTIPSKMPLYLMGTHENPKLIEPIFGTKQHTFMKTVTENFELELGDEYKDYELFSCRQIFFDEFENVTMFPTNIASYDSETGIVTFTASEENPIQEGTIFDMDFYTDGYFVETLSTEIMNILGMCFQVQWQTRFNNDWLSNVSKVEDKSFFEQNRANKIKADDSRHDKYESDLASAMRRYEQNLAQRKMFPFGDLI